ncbi:integrase, partial [Providencia rettgeri]|nr:integrase [Providencia rettgeri]
MSAILTERLVSIAQAARKAGHGKKEAIYQAACEELNLSRATLLRRIKEVAMTEPRKRRNDSGKSALTRDEALLISAVLKESTRKNGKRLYSIKDAVNELRANNMIRAELIDETTGEVKLLSESAISRALRAY